jgi:hypothetical protein
MPGMVEKRSLGAEKKLPPVKKPLQVVLGSERFGPDMIDFWLLGIMDRIGKD